MAKRPVFVVSDTQPFFVELLVDFQYHSGFSIKQNQESIKSLHCAFLSSYPNYRVLEISSKSENPLGVNLSAFNLYIETKGQQKFSVEAAFQASKVFENGGPYMDLLTKSSREAKKDLRLKNSGRLQYFYFINRRFDLNPSTYFYNWLYINTLHLYSELAEQLVAHDAFTDIAFSPKKSINCQARSAAIYVSLFRQGLLPEALKNKDSFLDIVYKSSGRQMHSNSKQMTLWD